MGLRLLLFPWLPHKRPSWIPKAGTQRRREKGAGERDSLANLRPPALYNPRVYAAEDPWAALLTAGRRYLLSVPLLPPEGQGFAEPWREKELKGEGSQRSIKEAFRGVLSDSL